MTSSLAFLPYLRGPKCQTSVTNSIVRPRCQAPESQFIYTLGPMHSKLTVAKLCKLTIETLSCKNVTSVKWCPHYSFRISAQVYWQSPFSFSLWGYPPPHLNQPTNQFSTRHAVLCTPWVTCSRVNVVCTGGMVQYFLPTHKYTWGTKGV